jgi:hypothetical protein
MEKGTQSMRFGGGSMNHIKGLQGVLLGGAALIAMMSGGRADELAALKGELEALQSRVDRSSKRRHRERKHLAGQAS